MTMTDKTETRRHQPEQHETESEANMKIPDPDLKIFPVTEREKRASRRMERAVILASTFVGASLSFLMLVIAFS